MSTAGWHDPVVAAEWDAVSHDSPVRAEQLDLLLAVVEEVAPDTVLEVGVGSAIVAERILRQLPEARLVGVDHSAAMLDLARSRLAPFGRRARLTQGDLSEPFTIGLGPETFEVAYSVQALHHLSDAEKALAFRWLGEILPTRAWLLLRDKVKVPSSVFPAYDAVWRRTGASMPSTAGEYAQSLRDKGDYPAGLESQLRWLRNAGFTPGVVHACGHYALIAARRD